MAQTIAYERAPGGGGDRKPSPEGIVLDPFGGPGGWAEGLRMLGVPEVGIELDAAACATRRAAGHHVIRADVAGFPAERLAGKVWGQCDSPPCTTFSMAGDQAGNVITEILAAGIRDAMAGRKTRALRRREMAHALRVSSWGGDRPGGPCHEFPGADWKWTRKEQDGWKRKLRARRGSPAALRRDMAAAGDGRHPTRVQRSAKIQAAVRSAALVIEPARYLHAAPPEWVALEQVPSVLPLWRAYAAELTKLGYHVWCGKLNAADYGVPQTRERAILIASRTRQVYRPEPTHYDPRKGMQLWGTPWVSMAEALGWGATGRPGPAVTAGGTATGGAEPFPTRGRALLEAERDAGRWLLHTNRDQRPDGSRQTADPRSAPAPALTAKSGGQWVFRNNNNNACERTLDEPAGTLFFGLRSNWAAWVHERPSPTIVTTRRSKGGLLAGRQLPAGESVAVGGHGWDGETTGASKSGDAVRITVQEAAVLQSFRPDYPWQGTKTKQFEQCGNAVPPLLAMHVVAMATGLAVAEVAA